MTAWLRSCVCVAALAMLAGPPQSAFAADAAHPTVVELFQSQGCSSCPPAAANVAAISDRADVLALSFAVDYWDRLGWKDTFSKAAWTARQYAYARAMGRGDNVYTPQVVVNGRVEGDGLEPGALAGLMSRGDRAPAVRASAFPAARSRSARGPRPRAGRTCGSPAMFRAPSRSRSRAARTPATPCPTRMWCAKWSSSAIGGAKRRASPWRARASPASPRRPWSRAAAAVRFSRRRNGDLAFTCASVKTEGSMRRRCVRAPAQAPKHGHQRHCTKSGSCG